MVWEVVSPNSPLTQRQLMFQLGKESRETIEVQLRRNNDIMIMENGFMVGETKLKSELHNMYDRKASDMHLGCIGAYCDLCTQVGMCERVFFA